MKKINLFIAKDGLMFTNEDVCKQYEEEIAKHPNDPGIIFYNVRGKEIDNFEYAMGYKVTNKVIADAIVNSFTLSKNIQETVCTDPGCYAYVTGGTCGNRWDKVSETDLFLLITH